VRREALPEPLPPRLVAVEDRSRAPLEDNALLVTLGAPGPRAPELIPLWAECLVPAAAVATGPGHLALVRARLRERLGALLPFLDAGLVVLASPHDGLAPELPRGGEDAPLPAALPATPMDPVLTCNLPRTLEIAAAPHAVGLRATLLANREVLPGLGEEGDYLTALGAARLLQEELPMRGTRRREILIRET
jgi:hypothetical protein